MLDIDFKKLGSQIKILTTLKYQETYIIHLPYTVKLFRIQQSAVRGSFNNPEKNGSTC